MPDPSDALYGLRSTLFGEPRSVRDDHVALAAQTEMAEVQRLIDQGDWEQAQAKLVQVSTSVQTVDDTARKQNLVDEWNQLAIKVDSTRSCGHRAAERRAWSVGAAHPAVTARVAAVVAGHPAVVACDAAVVAGPEPALVHVAVVARDAAVVAGPEPALVHVAVVARVAAADHVAVVARVAAIDVVAVAASDAVRKSAGCGEQWHVDQYDRADADHVVGAVGVSDLGADLGIPVAGNGLPGAAGRYRPVGGHPV